ncbi:MAG: hypothetical protein ACXU82_00285 [Caulobacteraceae bacterium]
MHVAKPLVLAAILAAGYPSEGRTQSALQPAATPKGRYAGLDRLPDWGGVWVFEPGRPRTSPQLKGPYLERYRQAKAQADANHGEFDRPGSSYCAAPGMPYQMGLPQYPMEFLFTPGRVTILFEAWTQVRRVFTDGRPHPADLDATFYGHSIGHWEGDTLVVDTTGIKPAALLAQGVGHSDKETILERIHLTNEGPDELVDELTVIDPEALAQPWTQTLRYRRHREWDLLEYVCSENDRNPVGNDGRARF